MNLLKKLTNKSLQLNKKRTIVTIIGIILSVALVTAVTTMYVSLYKSLIRFEIVSEGNYHVSFNDVSKEKLNYIKENRNIENYFQIEQIGYAKLEGSKNEFKPYLYFMGFTEESLKNLSVNLIEGRLPENDHELLVSNHIKTNGRVEYHVGEKLTINIGKRMLNGEELNQDTPFDDTNPEEIIDTEEYTYTIVGIIERPSNSIENYQAPGYSCITYIKEIKNNSKVFVRFTKEGLQNPEKTVASIMNVNWRTLSRLMHYDYETEEEAEELLKEIENARLEPSEMNNYLIKLESGLFRDVTFRSLAAIVTIIATIIVVTSVFCIKNSFDISISEKTRQYGMLSSIGATRKQIRQNVYYEAFKLGLVGIPLGIILGIIASSILILICNILLKGMLNINMVLAISIPALLVSIFLGIVTIFFSSMRSANRASRISAISAIRNSEDIKINSKKIKAPKLIKKLFGIGGEISYKNLKRSKKKYRTTVISIIVCVAVYIALSSFMHTFYQYLVIEYSAKDYNIDIYVQADDFDRIHNKMSTILAGDDIKDYSVVEEAIGNIKYPKTNQEYVDNRGNNFGLGYADVIPDEYQFGDVEVIRLGEHQYKEYLKKLRLDYENTKDKIILVPQTQIVDKNFENSKKINALQYKKGEQIIMGNLIFPEDEDLLIRDHNYEIAAVTEQRPFGFSEVESLPLVVLSDEEFRKFHKEEQNYEKYFIDAKNPDKFQDEIEKTLNGEEVDITNIYQQQKQMKSLHLLIGIFLYGFVIVIALIGITNIFNTITTNMELRKREFASLKSVGMTSKEFNRMISLESFFYGTKSLLIGIPIGLLLSYGLIRLLNGKEDIVPFKIPYLSILISILIVFVLITIIMKYSITKINKQNTIETIRNENI